MNKFGFFIMLLMVSMLSCKSKKEGFDYKQNVIHIKGEPLQIEQMIGQPHVITYINDTLLIYYDRYDDNILSVFDLKNNHFVGRFVSEGQGPNEVIGQLLLLPYPQKDKLYAYQNRVGTISIFDAQGFNIQNNISIDLRPNELQKSKDYYIGTCVFGNARFAVYDSQGILLYTGGSYPFKGDDMESPQPYLIYSGTQCANPNKNYFAAACTFSDHIAFYEITENAIIPIKEYYSYDATVEYTGRLMIKDNSVISYNWAFGTASYCYMLFSGKTHEENRKQKVGQYIIVFDWQGNYKKTFSFDYNIYYFCVDEKSNYIYAITREEDGSSIIVKMKI
jgi:hypothetical protein